jgi:hypothetical protein
MDCDRAGRIAAGRIAGDLQAAGAIARMVDLAPGRDDGYDLTDWLAERDSDPPASSAPDPSERSCSVRYLFRDGAHAWPRPDSSPIARLTPACAEFGFAVWCTALSNAGAAAF